MHLNSLSRPSRQRGLSFFGLIMLAVLAFGVFIIVVPAGLSYMEFISVQKAAEKAKVANTVEEAQKLFDKAAQVTDIASIAGKDLKVTKRGDQVVVGYEYQKEIHIVGPAYLTMKYSGQTK